MMTLLFHFTNDEHCVGLVDPSGSAEWFVCGPSGSRYALLEKAVKAAARARGRRVSRVAVTLFQVEEGRPYPASWSALRAATAAANTLAFAWGIPVAGVAVAPTASKETAAARIMDGALDTLPEGEWLRPEYSGEPNITTPKEA